MIAFYLGGVVACASIFIAEAAAAGEPFGIGDVVGVLVWPITVAAFIIDIIRGWRA